MKRIVETVGYIAVAAFVAVALYLGGWWLTKDSTSRDAKVKRQSYGAQTTYADRVLLLIGEIETLDAKPEHTEATTAQRAALVTQACRLSARITTPFQGDIAPFVAKECS